jgi:putative FmdB family regulatory protein
MPVYEYKCLNPHCDKVFDIWNKKFEDSEKDEKCPECGTRAKRIFSPPAAIII